MEIEDGMIENLAKVSRNGQLALPPKIRRALQVRIGDYVQMQVVGKSLVLTPKKVIDKDQSYYWSKEWQAVEREADADIASGRVCRSETVDDLIKELNS